MMSMRGVASDEDRVTDIKKLLTCGTFYFAWTPPQGPISQNFISAENVPDKFSSSIFGQKQKI
jgi:hypothetical protein